MSITIRHKYTNDEIKFLKLITPGKSTYEITELFNKEFNLNLKRSQIRGQIKNKGFKTGIDMTYKKGNIPYLINTKGIAKPNKTSFKKGQTPHNKLEIGTEITTSDGYLQIKVGNPNHWIRSHRYIYMLAHGDIPKGTKIVFLDRDKKNVSLENLQAVTSQELSILNTNKLLKHNIDLSKTGVLTAKLIAATHNKIREAKS